MSENKQMQPFSQEGQGPQLRGIMALFIHQENSECTCTPRKKSNHCSLAEQLPRTEEKAFGSNFGNRTIRGVIKLEMQMSSPIFS